MRIWGKRDSEVSDPGARRRNIISGVAVFAGAMLLVAGAFYLARGAREFALQQWQTRLHANLAQPLDQASAWVEAGHQALSQVAVNATVQIYLSELVAAGYDKKAVPQGETQAAFVASYILSAAARGPFASPEQQRLQSGRPAPAKSGLALLDGKGQLVASSPGYKPSAALLAQLMAKRARGTTAPVLEFESGAPALVFFRPIEPLQGPKGATPVGYAIGARAIGGGFDTVLSSPLDAVGGRIALLAKGPDGFRYLRASNGMDAGAAIGTQPLSRGSGLVAALAKRGQLVRANDVDGHRSLLYGAAVKASPLFLVASVPEDVALVGVTKREQTLLGALLLAIFAMIVAAFAFSRHQAGMAASQLAVAAKREAASVARREALLRTVVNAYPGALILVQPDRTVGFVNARFAGEQGADAERLQGKPLEAILPAGWRPAVEKAFEGQAGTIVRQIEFDDCHRHYAVSLVRLSESVGLHGGALLLIDDITERVQARERRMQIYRVVVDILLEAIDRRDPAAAAHSRRVGTLAREVALMLTKDDIEIETVGLAGSLQGANKLFVPQAILRKAEGLSEAERAQVDEAAQRWLGLLDQISSDLPLATVLKAAHELAHGLQPTGLDEVVLHSAYIIAAANMYVALTSPRAHRAAHVPDEAVGLLERTLPSLPDEVLQALRKLAENRATVV